MDALIVAFVAGIYANLPAVVGRVAGQATLVGAAILALAAVGAAYQVFVRRRGLVLDSAWLLLVACLGPIVLSTLGARDPDLSIEWIGRYATEILLVYLLLANAVRTRLTLRRTMWAVSLTAAFLSLLCVYQELAHAPEQQFAGLALRDLARGPAVEAESSGGIRTRERVTLANRALGPIGDPNRFAQFLLFALPLAAVGLRSERRRLLRLTALGVSLAILAGVFLTYSRGAFLGLAALVLFAMFQGTLRWTHVLVVVVLGAAAVFTVAPGSLLRLERLAAIPQLIADPRYTVADGALRGRLTEMLAAYHVFLDHPILGVGPANYAPHYSIDYMDEPGISYRVLVDSRRGHSLYLEMAAEIGILGLVSFLAPIALLWVRLEQQRRRWRGTRLDLERLAAAFSLAIVAYLATAVFLHLSFALHLGLLLGLAGAALQVLSPRSSPVQAPVPRSAVDVEPWAARGV